MREIKFRFWDNEEKCMIGPDLSPFQYKIASYNGLSLIDYEREDEDGYPYEMDVEFMQYTGLKDRNGKEIYEGDITESEEMEYSDSGHFVGMRKVIGVVVYTSGRFALHHITGKLPDLNFGLNYHKVIGNRYENPELLIGGTGA